MLTNQEIRKLSIKDLNEELKKARMELTKSQLLNSVNQLKEVHILKQQRKYVARLKTAQPRP